MATFVNTMPLADKRQSREITFHPITPTRTHRILGIELSPTRQSQTAAAIKSFAGAQQPLAVMSSTTSKNESDQTISRKSVQSQSIEVAGAIAQLSELTAKVAALYSFAPPFSIVGQSPQPKPKRKYTPRKTDQIVEAVPLAERKWITIKQAAAIYPKTEQAFRHLAHQATQREFKFEVQL